MTKKTFPDIRITTSVAVAALVLIALATAAIVRPAAAQSFPAETALSGAGDLITSPQSVSHAIAWAKNPVTYTIENCPRTADCAAAQAAVRQALQAWDAVSGLTLVEAASGGDISIKWAAGAGGYPYPFDGQGGRLAHGIQPIAALGDWAGDVHFDDDENWVTSYPTLAYPQQVYLPSVALHEIGHALGLDHSTDPSSIMWPYYSASRSTLGVSDITAIQALYGAGEGSPAAASATVSAASSIVSPTRSASGSATSSYNLRMRSGPGTGYGQLGLLPARARATVLGSNASGSWLYIEYNGARGWVAGWYCTVAS
jgi:predicted Zn-dependent protease